MSSGAEYPVYLVRVEDDLVALHLALALSRHVPTALWRPGASEAAFNGLTVVGGRDLWQAAIEARRYALALVYAGEGPADFIVRGSTGCATYGVYSRLLKLAEEPAARIAVQALEWRQGEAQLDVERREGELPRLIVVVPRGVGVRELVKALRRYNPVVHRDLAAGLIDEIMPWVKRRWPKRGVVIAPSAAGAPEGALVVHVGPDPWSIPLDRVEEELRRIIAESPCVFGEYEEPAEFKPKGAPKPLSPEWARRLAQGISCQHELLCLSAIYRWPRLAYYMRRFPELADKLAALAVANEGQLVEVLKALAVGQRTGQKVEVPDYTEVALALRQGAAVVEPQVRASPPRRPPLVGKLGYIAVPLLLAGSLALGIGLAPFTFGLSLALPALYALAWPDAVLAWLYALFGIGIEPRLYYLGDGRHRDVFGRVHVIYRASPRFNALTASARSAYHVYNRLAAELQLLPNEAVEAYYAKDHMTLRYTGDRWEAVRGHLDRYFKFFEPVALSQSPLPDRPLRLASRASLALGALAGLAAAGIPAAGMLAWPLAALALRRRARAYAATRPMSALARFDAFALRTDENPRAAQSIAQSIASAAQEWGVVIRVDPKAESVLAKRFKRYYESPREIAGRVIGVLRYGQAVSRLAAGGERGTYVQAFAPRSINAGGVSLSGSLGSFDRWFLWAAKPALSGDLTALPFLGPVMYAGKAVLLGHDSNGQPIYLYPEVLPALHALIFGGTGMGKSWTAATLLMRLRQAGYNVHVIVIDPHGDYIKLRDILGARVIVVGQDGYVDVFSNADKRAISLMEKLSAETLGKAMGPEGLKMEFAELLVGNASTVGRAKDLIIAFSERARSDPVFMRVYGSLLVFQLYRRAFDKIREGKDVGEVWVILLDEAYLFLDQEILENLISGARKFGVAIWLVAHRPDFLTKTVLLSTYLKIILGGANVVDSIKDIMELSPEDAEWLRSAWPPREYAQALIVHGPADVRYHGYIKLEPIVKARS